MTNIDYSKTVIYKIVCKNEDVKDVYVGSTTRFKERIREHKKWCINKIYKNYNLKIYQIIRANGGWDNWKIEEIIKQPCNDSAEAHAYERYYYELLNCNMNTRIPGRTKQEYDKNNKDKKKEYQRKYYQKQRERKAELQKINHEKYKKEKLINYESNATRDAVLKQLIELNINII
jgi:hypothetical protein